MSKVLSWTGAAALGVALVFSAMTAQAAPETGACCNLILGCCAEISSSDVEIEGGVGGGQCRIDTAAGCNGIADTFKGAGTTCEEFCPIDPTTTSTTLFATTTTTILPTTTSTTLPVGACCQPVGTCLDVIEENCILGVWKGNDTECATFECPQPTTTTIPETTTTTTIPETTTTTVADTTTTTEPIVVLCGDANGDGEITAVDALIALKTSVGTAQCSVQVCDYNGNGMVSSSDALAILKVAVGQIVIPMCPIL